MISYDGIYSYNVKLARDIINGHGTDEKAWRLFYEYYQDPDGYPLKDGKHKYVGDVLCTADGLLSVNRIKAHEGFNQKFVEAYEKYRKTPIFFFPTEWCSINMYRAKVFGDRMDHTLFDLKRKYAGADDCRLEESYSQPKTKKWLENFHSFGELVDWLGIRGSFVNDDLEVIDLEKNDGSVITNYAESYEWEWSETYYKNVKKIIEKFEKVNNYGYLGKNVRKG